MRGFEKITKRWVLHDEDKCVTLPTRGSKKSAGYDFYTTKDYTIKPGATVLIQTGVKAYMPEDEVLYLFVRSSIGIKKSLMLPNSVGVIDSDYYNNPDNEGEILGALHNYGTKTITIKQGERFMQGVFMNFKTTGDVVKEERIGGIGSTN